MQDLDYQKNLAFWDTAWDRVKKLHKEPNHVDYLDEMPETLKKYNAKKILDIACGSGWLSVHLNSHGFDVTGIDLSKHAIELANQWKAENNLENIQFEVRDMLNLGFEDNSFDAIMVNSTLEHLDLEKAAEFFQEAKRVVKPEGLFFGAFDRVCVGDKGEFTTLADGTRQYTDKMRDGMILRYFSDDELKKLMADSQWDMISMRRNELECRVVWAQNKK